MMNTEKSNAFHIEGCEENPGKAIKNCMTPQPHHDERLEFQGWKIIQGLLWLLHN